MPPAADIRARILPVSDFRFQAKASHSALHSHSVWIRVTAVPGGMDGRGKEKSWEKDSVVGGP